MHIVRTIIWVLIAVWALFFFGMNWGEPVPVRFWPVPINNPLMFEWPVSLVAAIFFILGLVPMWLYNRAQKWMLKRRIHSLENAARTAVVPAYPVTPSPELAPETSLAVDADPVPETRPPVV